MIYNAVLRASRTVTDALKPGVCWVAMHKLSNRIVLEDLVKAGILKGDVDEMMKVSSRSLNCLNHPAFHLNILCISLSRNG